MQPSDSTRFHELHKAGVEMFGARWLFANMVAANAARMYCEPTQYRALISEIVLAVLKFIKADDEGKEE